MYPWQRLAAVKTAVREGIEGQTHMAKGGIWRIR